MSSPASARTGPLTRGWWVAGLAAIAAAEAVLMSLVHLSGTDDVQQLPLVTSLLSGDLVGALENPFAQLQTSGPGFGFFAAPIYAIARIFVGVHDAYAVASLACLVPLAWATIAVSRATGVVAGSLMGLSLIELPGSVVYFGSRYLPLLATGCLCGWLLRRRVEWHAEVAVAALAVAFLVRPPFDQAGFLYYAAPGYACFVLMGPRSWRWLAAGVAGSALLLARYLLRLRFPIAETTMITGPSGQLLVPGSVLALGTTLVFVAALVASILHLRTLVRHEHGPARQGDEVRPGSGGSAR